jgi:hypothetical protein
VSTMRSDNFVKSQKTYPKIQGSDSPHHFNLADFFKERPNFNLGEFQPWTKENSLPHLTNRRGKKS